jgi:succinate dehydrogenase / fumarate reductase cytochrome b subunit
VNKKRPMNLNPLSMRLPLPALVSITHRLSGILVFLLIPCLLWGLQRSLASPEGLNQVRDSFFSPTGKFVVWIGLAGILFHLCAGVRHLLMDVHIGDSLRAGRWGARVVTLVSLLLILGAGYWIGR